MLRPRPLQAPHEALGVSRTRSASILYEGGNRFVALSDEPSPIGNYRHRLNDYELLRRMLVIRVAALRADVVEAGMDAFLGTQPAALRHPYPDKAIRWDGVRGAFIAPTAIEGMFDEDGIVMSYRDTAS